MFYLLGLHCLRVVCVLNSFVLISIMTIETYNVNLDENAVGGSTIRNVLVTSKVSDFSRQNGLH